MWCVLACVLVASLLLRLLHGEGGLPSAPGSLSLSLSIQAASGVSTARQGYSRTDRAERPGAAVWGKGKEATVAPITSNKQATLLGPEWQAAPLLSFLATPTIVSLTRAGDIHLLTMVPTAKQPSADAADDLDDLDDILDEFNKPAEAEASNKQEPSTAQVAAGEGTRATQAAGPGAAASAAAAGADSNSDKDEEDDELKERFSRELAQGMEALMRGADPELAAAAAAAGGSPGAGGAGAGLPGAAGAGGSNGATAGDGSNLFDEEQMMKQFEQMMADMGLGGTGSGGLGAGPSSAPSAPSASSSSQKPQQPANFQDAIRSTMSRLRESDQTATSSAGQSGEMDFEKLFAAMSNSEGGEGGEEGIANMLESMMSELMSKEVLYDPLKELRDKVSAVRVWCNYELMARVSIG